MADGIVARIAGRIDARTPPGRDRSLDALRVGAVLLVIFGHWMVRGLVAPEGVAEPVYLLREAPGWRWATLLFQVMPVIFLVGGAVNAESWRRAQGQGVAPVDWVRGRARRLLRPALPLLLVVVPCWVALEIWWPEALVLPVAVALVPLWFIAAYLAVTALTPLTLAAHERGWSLPLIGTATALALAVDLLRLSGAGPVIGTQPLAGAPNFVLVWVAVHQLGHLWSDGPWPATRRGQLALAGAGAAALALLLGPLGWPLSFVPVEGTLEPNNAAPPTVALLALTAVQAGLAGLLRPGLQRGLAQPRLWVWVALPGAALMTLFLWHQLALVVVANLAAALAPLPETLGPTWWLQRLPWVLACAIVLAPMVGVAGRFERGGGAAPSGGLGQTLAGAALTAAGVAGLLWLHVTPAPPVLALGALGLVLLGMRAVGALGREGLHRS